MRNFITILIGIFETLLFPAILLVFFWCVNYVIQADNNYELSYLFFVIGYMLFEYFRMKYKEIHTIIDENFPLDKK